MGSKNSNTDKVQNVYIEDWFISKLSKHKLDFSLKIFLPESLKNLCFCDKGMHILVK